MRDIGGHDNVGDRTYAERAFADVRVWIIAWVIEIGTLLRAWTRESKREDRLLECCRCAVDVRDERGGKRNLSGRVRVDNALTGAMSGAQLLRSTAAPRRQLGSRIVCHRPALLLLLQLLLSKWLLLLLPAHGGVRVLQGGLAL